MKSIRVLIAILFSFLLVAITLRLLILLVPGARVTSWFRSPLHNAAVGGKPLSWHLLGWGIDVVPVRKDIEDAARRIFPFVYNEGDHLHIGWIG